MPQVGLVVAELAGILDSYTVNLGLGTRLSLSEVGGVPGTEKCPVRPLMGYPM
jgi:hypothetical protein